MEIDEKIVLRRQYIAFFISLILFIPSALLSTGVFHNMKFGLLVPLSAMIYIGVSSLRNHVSIIRPKGRRAHSKARQAVIFGVITLVSAIGMVLFILAPLSDVLFPF